MVLDRWERVLHGLETDPDSLAGELDWVAKRRIVEGYRDRHGLDWDDQRLAAVDLQYHDIRPAKSLFARLDMERLVDPADIEQAVTEPPGDDAGLLPRPLPVTVRLERRRGQLGLGRLRRRRGSASPGADDGTA